MSLIVKDENGNTTELASELATSVFAVGIGTSPESAAGIVPDNLLSADRLLDIHKPDWKEGDDIQLHVGDLILNSRNGGSSGGGSCDVQADNQRGSNGNLGLGAKGLIFFYTQDSPSQSSIKMMIRNDGHVAIGPNISNFRERLTVEGNILATGDVKLQEEDCAEDFEVDEMIALEPGMVMVIGEKERLQWCNQAYDRRVAGVLSGAGNCRPGILLGRQQKSSQHKRLPLALTGKVYCKVDAQYAPVAVGDLLTTSPTLGHAMKASDPSRAFGAIVGKALRPLAAGRALVPILVSLQ
jgi:hypothetical protein